MPLELASHPQMNAPDTAMGIQGCHEVFAPALPLAHRFATETVDQGVRASWARYGSRSADLNLCNFEVDKTVCQSPTDRLDFREFRQRPQAGSSSASAKLLVLMPPSTPCRPL